MSTYFELGAQCQQQSKITDSDYLEKAIEIYEKGADEGENKCFAALAECYWKQAIRDKAYNREGLTYQIKRLALAYDSFLGFDYQILGEAGTNIFADLMVKIFSVLGDALYQYCVKNSDISELEKVDELLGIQNTPEDNIDFAVNLIGDVVDYIPIGTGNDLMDRIYENALSAYVYTIYKLKLNYSDERNENAFLAANKIASQGRFLTERDVAPFLGDMYLKGVGCEVDYDKAYYYCKLTNMNVEGLFITNPFTKKKDIPRTIKMRLQAEGYHKVK